MKFFDPREHIRVTGNQLPHWQQPGKTYFITYRLADSLPASRLEKWKRDKARWLEEHPPPLSPEVEAEYHRVFSTKIDQWLDQGHGSCVLRNSHLRSVVEASFAHFDAERYDLWSYVIMPNHCHVLASLRPDRLLEKVVFTWKRRTSGVILAHLGQKGALWQRDYFDRLIRDADHFRNVVRYIRRNPAKANLSEGNFTLWESDLAKKIE